MTAAELEKSIEAAWEDRNSLSPETQGPQRDAIETAIMGLDSGQFRVATRDEQKHWTVHQWLKKAVLLGFRLEANVPMSGGPAGGHWVLDPAHKLGKTVTSVPVQVLVVF